MSRCNTRPFWIDLARVSQTIKRRLERNNRRASSSRCPRADCRAAADGLASTGSTRSRPFRLARLGTARRVEERRFVVAPSLARRTGPTLASMVPCAIGSRSSFQPAWSCSVRSRVSALIAITSGPRAESSSRRRSSSASSAGNGTVKSTESHDHRDLPAEARRSETPSPSRGGSSEGPGWRGS
jgi:hypothetical protein